MSTLKQTVPEGKDAALWEIAQKRASFKNHAIAYIIVNAFLWALWLFTGNQNKSINVEEWQYNHYPWPIWTTLGWGIGLAFHFAGAYVFPKANSVESEYQKLKNQQK
jgi:2TM domain